MGNVSWPPHHASRVTHHAFAYAGFTLIEAMVSLVAGLVVIGAAFEGLRHFQERLTRQQQRIAGAQDLRLGLLVFESELRVAGTGTLPSQPPLLKAEEHAVEFQANLAGLMTTLTEAAATGQTDLVVQSGSGWPKGKRIVLCGPMQCAEHQLSRDGRSHGLSLTAPLTQMFAAGSLVTAINQVRYYLRETEKGRYDLMRMVDGGANALIGGLRHFRLTYRDRQGRPTGNARAVAQVRIELGLWSENWTTARDIGIRSP
jgi:type II secretory pathway component PulJ